MSLQTENESTSPSEPIRVPASDRYKTYDLRSELNGGVLSEIQAVEGVAIAYIYHRYELNVEKGGAFSWAEVDRRIRGILANQLSEDCVAERGK